MNITFLGQGGYLLEGNGCEIVIDPYLSDSVNRIAGRPRTLPIPIDPDSFSPNAVICTHEHVDHLDPDTVSQMSDDQLFITTSNGKEILQKMGKTNVVSLSLNESFKIGGFTVTAVYAHHTCEAFGIIVRAEGLTLYFSGDTLFDEKLFEIKKYAPNATFICINGRLGNMNVKEALTVAEEIGAKINVPKHYDMFASNSEDPHLFADNISGGFIMEFNQKYILTSTEITKG